MQIVFANRKIEKLCSSAKEMKARLGARMAEKLQKRLLELMAAENLEDMRHLPGTGCHELTGNLKGKLALYLVHPQHLILSPLITTEAMPADYVASRTLNNSSMTTESKFQPDYAVPPGRTLLETIEAIGIDQRELAERTGLSPKTLNQIIHGKAPLTQQTAVLLERVTSVPARIWNRLEATYQEQQARLEAMNKLAHQIAWLKQVPTRELINRGYLKETNDRVSLLEQTLAFFRVASVDAWREGWGKGQFAFRKSSKSRQVDARLAAWLRIAESEAERMVLKPYDRSSFARNLVEIRTLTTKKPAEFSSRMLELCCEAGVALCFVPEIKGGRISGAAKWLKPSKAMIAINLRGKMNDLFWFTFFHEAGHVLNDSKKETFIDIDYDSDPREREANDFARRMLIPPQFENRLRKLKSKSEILEFANEVGIAPGIVVGRLQHEKLIPYSSSLNHLKEKFEWAAQ